MPDALEKPELPIGGSGRRGTLRWLIGAVTALLALIEIASSGALLGEAWRSWTSTLRLDLANRLSDHLLQGAQNLAFERGRTNVLLRAPGPAGPADVAFVTRRRQAADQAFAAARRDAGEFAPALRPLAERLTALDALRLRADEALRLPRASRDPDLPGHWFAVVSGILPEIEGALSAMTLSAASGDGYAVALAAMKLHAMGLRNAAGQESSHLASALADGRPIDPDQRARIMALRGEAAAHWAALQGNSVVPHSPPLAAAVERVRTRLFAEFRPVQDAVLAAASAGGAQALAVADYTAASVPALDSVAALMNDVVEVTRAHVDRQRRDAERMVAVSAALLVLALASVIVLSALVARGVIAPLSRLTRTLHALAEADTAVEVPYTDRRDEVGRIAASLESFRRSLLARRRAEEALKLSQARYRAIFEHAAVGIAQVDAQGVITCANKSLARTFGMPSVDGVPVADLFQSPDPSLPGLLLSGGEIRVVEAQFRTADGEVIWGELTIARVCADGLEAPLLFVLFHDITARKQAEADLTRLATTDALTGAANRRHFLDLAAQEMQRARRYGRPLSLLMTDIDHFKAINDGHGHAAGDEVLKAYAAAVRQMLRRQDVLGRLGGEEFGILLPETGGEAAAEVAERLRLTIEQLAVEVAGRTLRITNSIGVAVLRPSDQEFGMLLSRADAELYKAKDTGRNCIAVEAPNGTGLPQNVA